MATNINVKYRDKTTDDYGTKKGSSLTVAEVDTNFYNIGYNIASSISQSSTTDDTYDVKNQGGDSLFSFEVPNNDKGSSQNIFKNIVPTSGDIAVADINNDTLYLNGGGGIKVNGTASDIITISHNDTSSVANLSKNNSGYTFIQDLAFTFDTYGHVTGATASSATLPTLDNYVSWNIKDGDTTQYSVTSGDTLTIASGGGITSNFTADDVLTISHNNTSSVANLSKNNSGYTFIQDLAFAFDTYGHVTGATAGTGTVTVNNGTTTVTAGGGISLGGDINWSADQAGNSTFSVSHADTSAQASVNNSGNSFIQDITLDTYGHITSIGTGTVSIGNGQIDGRTSGLGLSGSMDATANQSVNSTFTVTSNATTASTASTIAYRDTAGDIHARLFRSEYDATNANIGYMMTQVNTGTDNYMRPSTPAQVRAALNVANGATNTTAPNNGTLTLSSGSGMSGSGTFTADQAGNTTVTYTNTDKGSSQNIFKNINPSTGDTAVADINNDTLYLNGGGAITVTGTAGDTIAISHSDTSTQASVNNSGRTYIQDITLDTYGHITGISSATETVVNTDTNTTYTAGNGLDLSASNEFSLETDLRGNMYHIGHNTSSYTAFYQYYTDVVFLDSIEFRFEADGDFFAGGNITAYKVLTSSDAKLKTNIKKVDNALDKVCQLDGVTFDWIKDGEESAGVIAQNVEKVLPRAVTDVKDLNGDDTHKVVDYNQLSALFIEAIKELKDENKELRAMIEELKSINS